MFAMWLVVCVTQLHKAQNICWESGEILTLVGSFFYTELENLITFNVWEARVLRFGRRAINNRNVAGVYFVHEYFTKKMYGNW